VGRGASNVAKSGGYKSKVRGGKEILGRTCEGGKNDRSYAKPKKLKEGAGLEAEGPGKLEV